MPVFLYGIGDANEARCNLARTTELLTDGKLVVDAVDQRDQPLHCRPLWQSLTRPKLNQLLRIRRKPLTFAQHDDLIIVQDIATLGPFGAVVIEVESVSA